MMRTALMVLAFFVALSGRAQPADQVRPATTYGAAETKKKQPVVPVFWSATQQQPPLPFNPFPELTVYDAGNNNLIYDDREVDYPALQAAMAKEQAELKAESDKAKAAAGETEEEGGGGMALRSSGSSTNLTLATPVFDGTHLLLSIQNGVAGEFYDLFYSTNLVDWLFYVRTDIDQFSFSITPPAWPVCFFRLGTQQDSDDDTLTDAYEALVTQTSPTFPDSAQMLFLYPNLNAFQISNLVTVLTDQPPVLEMERYEQDYSFLFLNGPCDFPTGNHFDSYSFRTRWTNNVGGFYTNSRVWNYCVSGSPVSTNYQREGRIAANVLGTNYYRSRVDNGAWSIWTNDTIAAVPWPGAMLVDMSYRRTVQNTTNGTSPLEVYRRTDSSTAKLRYRTGGPQFSTATRRHKITVGATAYDPQSNYTTVSNTLISILNLPGNSNGVFYVTLRDNTTNDLTPTLPAAYTNYGFSVSAERHLIPLNFRNSGYLTGPDTNGVGYDFNKYAHLISYVATTLGVHATIDDGTSAGLGMNWMNLEEINATVPTLPYLNWAWHQDKQLKRYLWIPGATNVTVLTNASFSTLGPDGGNDLPPQGGTLDDSEPDTQGNVYFPDAPSLTISAAAYVNAPAGSVSALRFYGHTWLTGNAAFATSILKWRTFITIKKTTNGWERVGPDNFIDLTPNDDLEIPSFTVGEASGL